MRNQIYALGTTQAAEVLVDFILSDGRSTNVWVESEKQWVYFERSCRIHQRRDITYNVDYTYFLAGCLLSK